MSSATWRRSCAATASADQGRLGRCWLGRCWLGQGRRSATEGRADRLVGAPVADPARPRAPVARRPGALDGLPECLNLALGGEQIGLVRLVAHYLPPAPGK